ncbi:MAG: hypothetical protein IJM51_10030 [Clostridia bacterium]|nr:hypothetical protein [Clostridia bacterium]
MLNKLFKSLLVISGTMLFAVLLGIICFGKSMGVIFQDSNGMLFYPGLAITVLGLLLSLASSIFILKYFIFFTRTRVVDSEGNTLSDNRFLTVGSFVLPPIIIAAAGVLFSMVLIGTGFGLMFDILTMYVVNLFAIASVFLIIAAVIFLFSVIRHKIRRRFAWIASGLLGFLALIMITAAVPGISDMSVRENELSAITATVVQTSSYTGFLSGPGKSVIRIKGTSGEMITLRYGGSRKSFSSGKKYTFYYLPKTHLIKKVTPADNIQY